MKICAVSQSFFPYTGGVSYYLLWLGCWCNKIGHKLYVIHLRPKDSPVEEEIKGIKVYRVPKNDLNPRVIEGYTRFKELILKVFHCVEASEEKLINKHLYGFNEYLIVNTEFAKMVKEVYEKENFDLLHVHDFQVLPLGSMLRDLKVPKIFTWHIPFTSKVPKVWIDFIINYMKEYDNVVLSTKSYVATALHHGMPWNKISCIAPFVTVEKPEINEFRKKYGINHDEKIILCVARIDSLKGQDKLIKALPNIIKAIPKVKCVFIGNGSMTKEVLKASEKRIYDQNLKQLVKELQLQDKVIFTGSISRDELMQAYEACDVVVLPSIMEGFGLTIAEGMAFGKPVIGSATGGIMMQIWPGVNGYLLKPNDVEQLSQAIITILSNDELRKSLGVKAREIYEKQYSLERGVRDNLDLYERVLALNSRIKVATTIS
ncbi:MAG: glycosyltransferase family 4 protein [Nitrososphaerales archaeon]